MGLTPTRFEEPVVVEGAETGDVGAEGVVRPWGAFFVWLGDLDCCTTTTSSVASLVDRVSAETVVDVVAIRPAV